MIHDTLVNETQSEFNSSIEFLRQLNTLFFSCNQAAINYDAWGWFQLLRRIEVMMFPNMKDEEIERADKYTSSIKPLIEKHLKRAIGRGKIDSTLYELLTDYNKELGKTANRLGYLMKFKGQAGLSL